MCVSQKEIDAIDRELVRIAKEGTVKEFVEAMLAHPIDGRLMRAFALEEDAPGYDETTRRIQEKFGLRKEEPAHVGSQSGEYRGNH
ncbi:MAG: hypothetical protein H8D67_12090 [Deltaproteobacteria bacterium]|nr:hypothetical protein [Deltaproteobacteria bacterium]